MKLFVDTANLNAIATALEGGYVEGVTTNPSLLAKEPKGEYLVHMARIVELLRAHGGTQSLSVEVFSDDHAEMLKQAGDFVKTLDYPHLAVKIHISHRGKNNLSLIKELTARGIAVNCTACMTPMQAMLAAASGARFVSLFYNRIRDSRDDAFADARKALLSAGIVEMADFDPDNVTRETRTLISDYPRAEIIAGSIRTVTDVKRALLAGAHIITVPPPIFDKALAHHKTDEAVGQFMTDFARWME